MKFWNKMLLVFYFVWLTQLAHVAAQTKTRRNRACPQPPDFLFGRLLSGRRRIGSVRTYECSPGLQAVGDPTIRCQDNLTWTQLRLRCLSCPPPAEEFGCGRISPGSNTLQSTRKYKCKPGTVPPESLPTTCLPGPDGPQWSVPAQKCSDCASPPLAKGSQLGPPVADKSYGEKVAFLCESGLVALGRGEVSCVDRNGIAVWTKPVQGCAAATVAATAQRVLHVDHCKDNPCLNSGKCSSTASGYRCSCKGGYSGDICKDLKTDCTDILSSGAGDVTGVYTIQPVGSQKYQVVCDMDTDGGGWTVIQSRKDVRNKDFQKPWISYEQGFGTIDPAGSFWLGLEKIHQLTRRGTYEVRIDIEKDNSVKAAAIYQNFGVGDRSSEYKLTIGAYSYDTSVGYANPGDSFSVHNGALFSTSDKTNAGYTFAGRFYGCGENYKGGWWYRQRQCYFAILNGPTAWNKFNHWNALSKTKMMIRKK